MNRSLSKSGHKGRARRKGSLWVAAAFPAALVAILFALAVFILSPQLFEAGECFPFFSVFL